MHVNEIGMLSMKMSRHLDTPLMYGLGFSRLFGVQVKSNFLDTSWMYEGALKIGGGNGYDIPHIKKKMLERQGCLPLQLSYDDLLVHAAMAQIND